MNEYEDSIQYDCGGQCVNVKNGRHGRDGRDGRDGKDGKCKCDSFPLQQGIGLYNTTTYSLGKKYYNSDEILYIINRKLLPITYIGIIWSSSDTSSKFTINLSDILNKLILTLDIGPSKVSNTTNVYEIYPSPSITTNFTRLIKFALSIEPADSSFFIYSIMIGFN